MSTLPSLSPSRALVATIVAVVAALSLATAAQAAPPPPDVPGDITPVGAHKPYLVGQAVGVQIYPCVTTPSGGYAWGPTTPRADLYGDNGKVIIEHFGGPSWQATDGSTVVAKRVNGVTVDPTAIPWLLLEKTSATAGPDGDRLADTTYIQRIATTGGLPPAAADCNAATAGSVQEVPYTADYVFWKATGN